MRHLNTRTRFFIFWAVTIIAIIGSAGQAFGQEPVKRYIPVSQALYDTIARMDSLLFNSFNNRDLAAQKKIFSVDIEFYHDKGGLTRYDQVIENTKRLFDQDNGLKRTLVPGSMEVYPIKDYGAVQIGMHRFCHKENGKDDCGTFKFIHIWQQKNGEWKLARVISYDH